MPAKYRRLFPLLGLTTVLLLLLSMPVRGAPGDTELISLAPEYSDNPAISPDGRYVVYETKGRGIQLHDRHTGVTERVDRGLDGQVPNGDSEFPDLGSDGRFITFHSYASNLAPGDATGRFPDIPAPLRTR